MLLFAPLCGAVGALGKARVSGAACNEAATQLTYTARREHRNGHPQSQAESGCCAGRYREDTDAGRLLLDVAAGGNHITTGLAGTP